MDVAPGFEPVLLDLHDTNDYTVLVAALHDYAGQLEHEADGDEADARHYGNEPDATQIAHLRDAAARLHRMLDDIERQLDANSEARKVAGDDQ
ncbi:hypothetical protein [uncultured Aeromicrobium sp.]|uniref:hypothetical protein n=1 Tax=uncultured Aeromicrobium sp. TaxID=337820 RepID=UPI0025D8523E|nr:hypothetical protein [uncultured Aeromicrobium sp.]